MSLDKPCTACEANAALSLTETMYAQIHNFKQYYDGPPDFTTLDAQQALLTGRAEVSWSVLLQHGARPRLPRYPSVGDVLYRSLSPEQAPTWVTFSAEGWQRLC